MICTFFGHRDVFEDIHEVLEMVLTDLIVNSGVRLFYVGNNGAFDRIALNVLRGLKEKFKHIHYFVVLAYFPDLKRSVNIDDGVETIYPFEYGKVYPRFAIDKRNRWMIDKAQVVVTYVIGAGSAEKFKNLAERKGKTVINIPDLKQEKPL